MTPQERQMLKELFDRLASLENTPRDAEAMRGVFSSDASRSNSSLSI